MKMVVGAIHRCLCSLLFAALIVLLRADYTVSVLPADEQGTWEGWGASLSGWGLGVGNSTYETIYVDLLFTQNAVKFNSTHLPGLGFNIARYNVGGGGRPEDSNLSYNRENPEKRPNSIRWYNDVDSFWLSRQSSNTYGDSWAWDRDANQRSLLSAAYSRGAKVEFFSRSPPWWMNTQQSSMGGSLVPSYKHKFTYYLVNVVKRAESHWGIKVHSLAPFDELSMDKTYPLDREGIYIDKYLVEDLFGYFASKMENSGNEYHSRTILSGPDDNNMEDALENYDFLKSRKEYVHGICRNASGLFEKINVHGFSGGAPCRNIPGRRKLRHSIGEAKRVWMTDYVDGEESGMTLARSILDDINNLRLQAWIYGEPVDPESPRGFVNGQYGKESDQFSSTRGKPLKIYTKYFVMAQFSRFLRPGYILLNQRKNSNVTDPNSIVGYDEATKKLVIVVLNDGNAQKITYDLSQFASVGSNIARVTVTQTNGGKLLEESAVNIKNKAMTINVMPRSIYSVIIEHVHRSPFIGRYVKLEAISKVGPYDYVTVSGIKLLGPDGAELPRTGWTATANSEYSAAHSAQNVFSSLKSNFWASTCCKVGIPHYVIVDMKSSHAIGGFKYSPRYWTRRGSILKWNLYGSTDGNTWQRLSSGVFPKHDISSVSELEQRYFPLQRSFNLYPGIENENV